MKKVITFCLISSLLTQLPVIPNGNTAEDDPQARAIMEQVDARVD